MTVKRPKGAKGKADRLFSLLVRARGACECCGERRYAQLQTGHIISRRYSATRCDEANAFCLCASCHRHFTDNPLAFTAFCQTKRSDSELDWLQEKARPGTKVDWNTIADELETKCKSTLEGWK